MKWYGNSLFNFYLPDITFMKLTKFKILDKNQATRQPNV